MRTNILTQPWPIVLFTSNPAGYSRPLVTAGGKCFRALAAPLGLALEAPIGGWPGNDRPSEMKPDLFAGRWHVAGALGFGPTQRHAEDHGIRVLSGSNGL